MDDTPDPRTGPAEARQIHPKIGYPATWRDYSAITIRRDDLLGNVRRATAAECDRDWPNWPDPSIATNGS